MKELEKRLNNSQIAAVICNQWGDSGKGKVSDYLAPWADVYARGTGGPNAGHTVVINGKQKIYHLLPTGIIHDSEEKYSILGNGMVIDLKGLDKELNDLDNEGMPYDNLMISKDAHVIMPYHIIRDRAKNQSMKKGGIGSTGKGMGPAYAEKTSRRGITVNDLFDRSVMVKKINNIKEFYPEQKIKASDIIEELEPYIKRIEPFVRDTVTEMHDFIRNNKKILIEGAQGLLLSIDHGTYPYVTSSDCSINGTASGVGISAKDVDLPIGVVKFPFMTRVGAGPFPTEFGGRISEDYCAQGLEHDVFFEAQKYLGMPINLNNIRKLQKDNNKIELEMYRKQTQKFINANKDKVLELINQEDPFLQGVGVRLAAGEYGATTARPRRTGWTDAVSARYARRINGPLMFLTKVDCLAGADEFKLCYGYKNVSGKEKINFSKEEEFLRKVGPVYKTYGGFLGISDVRNFEDLPGNLSVAIKDFERFTEGEVVGVSVGADREDTIII